MGNKISKMEPQQKAVALGVSAVTLLGLALGMSVMRSTPDSTPKDVSDDGQDDVVETEVEEEQEDDEDEDEDDLPAVDTDGWIPFKDERVGISWMIPAGKWVQPEKKLTLLKNGCDITTYSFRNQPQPGRQAPKNTHIATVRVVRPISGQEPKAEAMKRIELFKKVLAATPSPDGLEITYQKGFTLPSGVEAYEIECNAGDYCQYVCTMAYDNATIFFEEARTSSHPRIAKGMVATHLYTDPSQAVFQWIAENGFEFTLPSRYILKKTDPSTGLLAKAYTEFIFNERSESGGAQLNLHQGNTLESVHTDLKVGPDVENFQSRGKMETITGIKGEVVSFSQNDQQHLVFSFVLDDKAYSFNFYTLAQSFNHEYRKQALHCFKTLGQNEDSFRKVVNSVYSCIMNIPYEHRIKELYGDYFQSISNLDCTLITTLTMKKLPAQMKSVAHAVQSTLFEMMRAKRFVRLQDGRTAQIPVYKLVSQGVRDHQIGKVGQIIVQTNDRAPKILLISLIPRHLDGELFWVEVRTQADPSNWSEQYCADLHGSFHFSQTDEEEEPSKPLKENVGGEPQPASEADEKQDEKQDEETTPVEETPKEESGEAPDSDEKEEDGEATPEE